MAERHHIVMIGAPGAGKGTQAARLAERLGASHLDAGALLRERASEDSPLGDRIRSLMADGSLVPDELAEEVIGERLGALPADQGFVLDGYPRNLRQAQALQRLLGKLGRLEPRPVFVHLDVPRDALLARLRGRRDLAHRDDDAEEVIARRLEVYESETAPVIGAVTDWADVITINGDQPPDDVADEIAASLGATALS